MLRRNNQILWFVVSLAVVGGCGTQPTTVGPDSEQTTAPEVRTPSETAIPTPTRVPTFTPIPTPTEEPSSVAELTEAFQVCPTLESTAVAYLLDVRELDRKVSANLAGLSLVLSEWEADPAAWLSENWHDRNRYAVNFLGYTTRDMKALIAPPSLESLHAVVHQYAETLDEAMAQYSKGTKSFIYPITGEPDLVSLENADRLLLEARDLQQALYSKLDSVCSDLFNP